MTHQASYSKWPIGCAAVSCAARLGLLLSLGSVTAGAQVLAPGTEDPNNWPQYHRSSNAWRYSPLEQITTSNVARLQPEWVFSTGLTSGHQAAPVVNGGVMFFSTPDNQVFAIECVPVAWSAGLPIVVWRRRPEWERGLFYGFVTE